MATSSKLRPQRRKRQRTPPREHEGRSAFMICAGPSADWLAASGYRLPMIGRGLNHSQPSATAVYARLDVEPVRGALEANAHAMLEVERSAASELVAKTPEVIAGDPLTDKRQPEKKRRD